MDISANAEKIITQAEQWTFAGDCALLQWMEQIGKNLEQRAIATNKNFDELSVNLQRTGIALDNVTNSLAALQYTQFVENRCHDDDETIANITDVSVEAANKQDESMDADAICKTILHKNLEVLRNCHERYSLDLEDSDGEDEEASNNFIYQPKNPYNERLLPHIYGTKLWHENWHVGLCDDDNSYSGDEISEAFSESSSSPAEDNEWFESNSANIAEWASATSIAKEELQKQQPIRIQNASSLRGSQPIYPPAQESLSNIGVVPTSETSSAISAMGEISVKQNEPRFDMFAPVRDSPPAPSLSSSSSASSLPQQQLKNVIQSKANVRRDSAEFVEKPEKVNAPYNSSYAPPIKRRPVNLFDDDDFSSFLTEIVDKSTSRESAATNSNEIYKPVCKDMLKEQEPIEKTSAPNTQPIKINAQTNKKPTPLNLFDSPDSSPKTEDLFAKTKEVVIASGAENIVRPKLSTKTLFDDDDDDDFMTIFAAKKQNISKTPVSKLNLFDDDDDNDEDKTLLNVENVSKKTLDKNVEVQKLQENNELFKTFENVEPKDFSNKKQNLVAEPISASNTKELQRKEDYLYKKPSKTPVDLFADIDVPEYDGASKNATPPFQQRTDLFSSTDDESLFRNTFEQSSKSSVKNLVENIGDTSPVAIHITQNTQENFKDLENPKNMEVPGTISNKRQSTEDINTIQGATGDAIDVHLQDNAISESNKVLEEDNIEVIPTNKFPEELPSVPQDTAVPLQKKVKNIYTDFFLDEPPDDDDDDSAFFHTISGSGFPTQNFDQDIYEPALPTPPTTVHQAATAISNPTSSYGNFGLFSDVPPDDDLENLSIGSANIISSNETKRIHSIFYDDFTETMEALNNRIPQENNPTLHSIFSDEPPPDDFNSFLQNPAKFDEIKTSVTKEVADKREEKTPPKSISVSKLKIPNININVQALMPGAAQKTQLRKSIEKEEPKESNSVLESSSSISNSAAPPPLTEIKRDSAENILVNVCKNRVRAPARRRPSTRQGRQENYRKSLVVEEEEGRHENIDKEQANAEERTQTTIENSKELSSSNLGSLENAVSTKTSTVPQPTEEVPKVGPQKLIADLLNEVGGTPSENKSKTPLHKDKPKLQCLFNDDEEENDDSDFIFGSSEKKINKESSLLINSRETGGNKPTLPTHLPADNFNIPNIKIKDKTGEIPVFVKEIQATKAPSNEESGNDQLFQSVEISKTSSNESTMSAIGASKGLFDDDDDEDDFIFTPRINNSNRLFLDSSKPQKEDPKMAKNKSIQNLPPPLNVVGDSKESESQSKVNEARSKAANGNINTSTNEFERKIASESDRKISNVNIFGDDDDDDDEDSLFGSSASKTKPQIVTKTKISSLGTAKSIQGKSIGLNTKTFEQQINKLETSAKVKSLFGSDEDEDAQNDDFLNAMKKPTKLQTRLNKAAERDDTKTLFSDTDDDDDDLFGSKTTKTTLAKSSQASDTKKSSMPPSKSMPNASIPTDNPLADLLFND